MASQKIDTNTVKSQPTIKRPIRAACFMFLILFALVGPCVLFLPGIDRAKAVLWGTGYCLFLSVVSVGFALTSKRVRRATLIPMCAITVLGGILVYGILWLMREEVVRFKGFGVLLRVLMSVTIATLLAFLGVAVFGWVRFFRHRRVAWRHQRGRHDTSDQD